MIFYLDFM